ncbi:hypothetical protein V8F20_005466 [Naviculisporaceae sp. PSN 640]
MAEVSQGVASTEPAVIDGRNIIILYGSETGNAEDIALELSKMTRRLHFKTTVDEMNNIKLTELVQRQLAIFVTSTTGQGDLPQNTAKFWANLRRTRLNNTNCLGALKFTIFGLGDSSYGENVNAAGRKLRSRLKQLGATEFFKAGEGDEQHENGIASAYMPWSEELKEYFIENYALPEPLQPIADEILLPPRYHIQAASSEQADPVHTNANAPVTKPQKRLLDIPNALTAVVQENTRLTPETHSQDVRLIKLDVSFVTKPKVKDVFDMIPYLAGATAVIYPKNFPEDVETLIDMMGWASISNNHINRKESTMPKKLYPFEDEGPVTIRDLLTHNFDINAVPRRSFLQDMAHFAADDDQKERLVELTKWDSLQSFYDYTSRPRRTILEVLRDFPSVRIPFDYALEMFPLMRGRAYSICNGANSVRYKQGENKENMASLNLEIIAALLEYQTVIRKPRQGVCSRYLRTLAPGTTINITINTPSRPTLRPNNMLIGASQQRPVIAVATGTGIAPIRALIGDLKHAGITAAPVLVFFGCRKQKADFYFQDEHGQNQAPGRGWGDNVKVIPAFSRDENPDGVLPFQKNYVQSQIRKHAAEIAEILTGDVPPLICVCGSSGAMPNAVREAFKDVLIGHKIVGATGEEEAEGKSAEEVEKLKKEAADKWLMDKNNVIYWQETW